MDAKLPRYRLPNRRLVHAEEVPWNNGDQRTRTVLVELGPDPSGRVREIFCGGGLRQGHEVLALATDASILASLLLQHGYTARELLAKLTRSRPDAAARVFADANTGIAAPSIIAKALDLAARFEAEQGAEMALNARAERIAAPLLRALLGDRRRDDPRRVAVTLPDPADPDRQSGEAAAATPAAQQHEVKP